jgi:hypothetical protein
MSTRHVLMLVFMLVVGLLGPFAVWAGIYLAVKYNRFTLQSMLRVMRVWRWISWSTGALLLLGTLILNLPLAYGLSITTFSIGLSFPQSWLKQRLDSHEATTA